MKKIEKVFTHERPHLDEMVAIWLLYRFGEKIFPGVSESAHPDLIQYLKTGGQLPDGRTTADYENEGMLLIGVGGGRFDEHPSEGSGRKKDQCSATLIAEALGLSNKPEFEKILKMTSDNDLKGSADPFGIAYIAKSMHDQEVDPAAVLRWVFFALDVKCAEQRKFHYETRLEFSVSASIKKISGPFGSEISIAVVKSDNSQMSNFARSKYGGEVSIVLQRRSTKNVAITNNQKFGIKMTDLVRMIRVAERKSKGIITPMDWKLLEAEGRVEGAEEWWYQEKTGAILNGSPTATDVSPTKLTNKELVELIKIAMNPKSFEPKRLIHCLAGKCNSSKKNPCPWFDYGLLRCRATRAKQYAEKSK